MPNQIMVIAPYWVDDFGAWVFDDPKVGLEPGPARTLRKPHKIRGLAPAPIVW